TLLTASADSWSGYGAETYVMQTRNEAWQLALDVTLPKPAPLWSDEQYTVFAPGADGASAIYAQPDRVGFVSADRIVVVPSDILLNGVSARAEDGARGAAHLLAAFMTQSAGDAGTEDDLDIVDFSSSGARGAIGRVALPSNPYRHVAAQQGEPIVQ